MFFELLNLHGIELSQEAKSLLTTSHKKNDKINYIDALPVIGIDQETNIYQNNWIIR